MTVFVSSLHPNHTEPHTKISIWPTSGMETSKCMKNKNQLDATYYFVVFLVGSTCFGHYYAHHQEARLTC